MSSLSDRYVTGEWSFQVDRTSGAGLHRLDRCIDRPGFQGVVETPHGYVSVYVGDEWRGKQWCAFAIVLDGRRYHRNEERPDSARITPRGATTIAGRWAAQVARAAE